jgi:putative Mg2+ transporter-C (MgtC) family protein
MLAFNLNQEWLQQIWVYSGDLHALLPKGVAGPVLAACAILCGMIIGMERRRHEKPAGLRTLTLICLGSAVYTLASILIAGDEVADRGRIAAQVVTGIGFLGAGVIIRDRGRVRGLTTGATIWAVAAIGVMIGAGYAVPGIVLSVTMLLILTVLRQDEEDEDYDHERKPARQDNAD